ncbi:MAG TPA: FkbM family methyltransferase [Flavipsychrobacter sp.]|jgi:FkbM family methyltransferase|nr:FkbM family methyltransferase [Flavipsychrobacter sp.]
MINFLKKLIYKSLGQAQYLKTLHRLFYIAYKSGYLKNDPIYKYHYFVKKLIKPTDTVIDLGGNLGYFTRIFASLTPQGKVIAIEPVVPFYKTLQWAVSQYTHITIHNYALGTEEKNIQMSVPKNFGYLRTGLASVAKENTSGEDNYLFEVQMKKASQLLADLPKIDYIKCDIEGYEEYVLPEMKSILEKHLPILQIETWGTHKQVIDTLMASLNYEKFILSKNELKRLPAFDNEPVNGDYLYIHPSTHLQISRP